MKQIIFKFQDFLNEELTRRERYGVPIHIDDVESKNIYPIEVIVNFHSELRATQRGNYTLQEFLEIINADLDELETFKKSICYFAESISSKMIRDKSEFLRLINNRSMESQNSLRTYVRRGGFECLIIRLKKKNYTIVTFPLVLFNQDNSEIEKIYLYINTYKNDYNFRPNSDTDFYVDIFESEFLENKKYYLEI